MVVVVFFSFDYNLICSSNAKLKVGNS